MADDLKRVGLVFKSDGAVDFKKTLKDINSVVQENRSEFKLAKTAWDDSTSALEKLGDQQDYLTKQTQVYSEKVDILKREIEELENAEVKDEKALKNKKRQLTDTQATLINYKKGLADVTNQIESGSAAMKTEMKALDESLSGLEASARENESAFKKVESQWGKNTKQSTKLKEEQKYLTEQSDIYTKKVDALSEQLKLLENAEERNEKAISEKRTELNRTETDLNNYNNRLKEVNNELKLGTQRLSQFGDKLKAAGNKMKSFGQGLTDKITKPALVAGTALAGVVLGKGWSRMTEIDNAKVKLKGIGNSAEDVSRIMDDATASVKGTSYALSEAASAAAGAVASGIKPGKDLQRYLSNIADAAAVAGSGMDEMGHIFGKVTTTGKATNESLQQLAERGLPIYQWLADANHTTTDAIVEMASKGGISLEMFQSAVEKNIGGAAQTMGSETIKGAIANLNAAIGRIGANFLGSADDADSFAGRILPLLNGLTDKLGGAEEKAKQWGATFGEVFGAIIDYAKEGTIEAGKLSDSAQGIFDALQPILDIVMHLASAFDELSPKMKTTFIVGAVSAGPLIKTLGGVASGLGGIFKIISLLTANPILIVIALVVAAVAGAAFTIFKNWDAIKDKTSQLGKAFSDTFENIKSSVADGISKTKDSISDGLESAKKSTTKKLNAIGGKFEDTFEGAKETVGKAIEKIKGFFDFEWSLPKLKMPHFSIDGKFGLNPPSVPKLNIDWYAKGGILNRPTIFGRGADGNLLGGGEAGEEAVLPIILLKKYVAEENAKSNAELLEAMREVFDVTLQIENHTHVGDREFYNTVSDNVVKRIDRKQSDRGALKGRFA